MAKDIIIEDTPPAGRVKRSRTKTKAEDIYDEMFFSYAHAQQTRNHGATQQIQRKKLEPFDRFYKNYPISHFEKEDLIELPIGTVLEYGDLYLDEWNNQYCMTHQVGQGSTPAYRYFRERANLDNIEGDESESFEHYAG